MHKINVMPTAEAIREMANTLLRYSQEMEAIAIKMVERNDITYASQAASAISNCMQNLRLDLIVTRPIREFMRESK